MSKNVDHLQHIKSNVVENGQPKLPTASVLVEGELAINYAEGYETISFKNSNNGIVRFSSDDYYTEQKLGSGFTGANSAKTVTEVIDNLDLGNEVEISSGETPTEETIELWVDTSVNPITVEVYTKAETDSLLLTKVNTDDVEDIIDSTTSASTNPVATSAVYNFVTAHTPAIEIDQVIDSGTSASTDAGSTSAVYGFVTSYTPSITVDQVLDNTTSASTNPVSSKAVYDAVTDNELVWTNAYVTLSGVVSSHTENTNIHLANGDREKINSIDTLSGAVTAHTANTEIHVTTADKAKLDSITGNVGTMAYENTSSYSSATEISTALGAKVNSATYTGHTADTSVHMSSTEKTNIDALATNIAAISGITSTKVGNWDDAATSSHTHSNKSALDSITGSVGTMAYENTSSYSSATEISTALNGKSDTNHSHEASAVTAFTSYQIASSSASVLTTDSLLQAIGKLEKRIQLIETAMGGLKLVKISQTDYDNLNPKDNNTLYVIV